MRGLGPEITEAEAAAETALALVPLRMSAAMVNAWSGGATFSSDENAFRASQWQDRWSAVLEAAAAERRARAAHGAVPEEPEAAAKRLAQGEDLLHLRAAIRMLLAANREQKTELAAVNARLEAKTVLTDSLERRIEKLTQERDELEEDLEARTHGRMTP